MVDNELFRNGSGYADITAYKAMQKYEREKNKMEFKRGELFEYEMRDRYDTKIALVVSANFRAGDRYLNVIILTDEPKGEVNVAITTTRGIMYADCGMVSFATNDRLLEFVSTVRDEEMEKVNAGIAECLGISSVVVEKEVVKEVPVAVPANTSVQSADNVEELAAAKAEAKVYKDLYESLLAKVMG